MYRPKPHDIGYVVCFMLHHEEKEEYEVKDFFNVDQNHDNNMDKKDGGKDNLHSGYDRDNP